MGLYNLGSVAAEVTLQLPDMPSYISGTPLERIVDRKRTYVEQYTGLNVGSVGIAEKFQPVLVNLTACDALKTVIASNINSSTTIGSQSSDSTAGNLKLGEFSYDDEKGSTASLLNASSKALTELQKGYCEEGMELLKQLGRDIKFERVLS